MSLSAQRDAAAACEDCQLHVSAASRAGKVERQLHRVLTDVPSARAAMVTLRNRRQHGCCGVDCNKGHAGKLHENAQHWQTLLMTCYQTSMLHLRAGHACDKGD